MSKANYNLICKPDNFPWVETCGFDVGHAFGILALVVLVDFRGLKPTATISVMPTALLAIHGIFHLA